MQVFSVDGYLIENNMFTEGFHDLLFWSVNLSIIMGTLLWLTACFTEVYAAL